jgi:2-polyprenyl-6-methoxyphenol hydroxylase-like FAD-dependent oxidoreductase
MKKLLGQSAIVIGGSLAGLMAARVLADHFEHVTILERDPIGDLPALRKSVPQASHAHALFLGGQQVMSRLYPGLEEKLLGFGGVRARAGIEFAVLTPGGKAYSFGGGVKEPRDLGFQIYYQSRSLLEHCVRVCTLEAPNVSLETGVTVQRLACRDGRIRGVTYVQNEDMSVMDADFVVDAGGRGSHTPRWLTELGFAPPEETKITVDFAYSSAKFHLPAYAEPERAWIAIGPGPHYPKAGFLIANEGNVWMLTLGGRFGDHPPADADGFLGFTKSLHTSKLYELVKDGERISEITHYRFPSSLQRHYEALRDFPERFVVLGDAVASFNPVYGQGMSSAALQAEALQFELNERAGGARWWQGFAQDFFARVAEVIVTPWRLAAHSDFAFPQTRGDRPPGLNDNDRYLAAVEELSAGDKEVQRLVWEVFNLAKPLSALSEEPLRSRVLAKM